MQYAENILNLIGNTPMLHLGRMTEGRRIYGKAEFLNPGGSIKDRVARYLIEEAERDSSLTPEMTIAEATSGNTGIGVAFVGRHKGYRVVIVMPEKMSEERKKIIRALGAELVLTPGDSIEAAVERLDEMAADDPSIWRVGQFVNPRNPETHYLTTAHEIWDQMEGDVAAFVAGVGSGGTLGGVGKFLKEKRSSIRIVAVEPKNAAALLGHEPGLHQIQGIGDGFVPPVLDTTLIDDIITVSDEDAIETTRELARTECVLAGTSSGANVWAAIKESAKLRPDDAVVTVLPDRAERYFSTSLL